MREERELMKQWLLRDKYPHGFDEKAVLADLARVEGGEPIDYVIGWRSFLGAKIDLAHRPLIPREATEYWVEKAISEVKNLSCGREVQTLDLFAGSGAIGIAFLRHIPRSHVDFGEIEKKFIEQIAANLTLNDVVPARFDIIETDVFQNIKGKYDYIFANPPYLGTDYMHHIQDSVLEYEPHGALFAGKDGMDILEIFLAEAESFLRPKGVIYFEFHSPQKEKLEALLRELGYRFSLHKDQFDLYRWGRAEVMQ